MTYDIQIWVSVAAFTGAGLSMGLGAIGAAVGEGHTAAQANSAISQNPEQVGDIFKSMLVGQAIAESASIFALVIAMILLFTDFGAASYLTVAAVSSAGLCMGLGAIGSGIGSGFPAGAACLGIARQPDMSRRLMTNMLIGSAVCQTPSIFALVVAMILLFADFGAESYLTISAVFAAGLCMGLGAIGSGIGSGFPADAACEGMSRQPGASKRLTANMLIGSAVCQTPSIFALVTSFILLFTNFSDRPISPTWAALLGAGISSGLGAIGSGLGGGLVAEASCEGIARKPTSATPVTNVMLLGQAVTQTTAIYGLLVSFILMFKVFPAADTIAPAMALLGAGLCMGLGAIGPGIGEGITARSAVSWVARNEGYVAGIIRVMLVGQAVSESTGIYSLVIALLLLFVV